MYFGISCNEVMFMTLSSDIIIATHFIALFLTLVGNGALAVIWLYRRKSAARFIAILCFWLAPLFSIFGVFQYLVTIQFGAVVGSYAYPMAMVSLTVGLGIIPVFVAMAWQIGLPIAFYFIFPPELCRELAEDEEVALDAQTLLYR